MKTWTTLKAATGLLTFACVIHPYPVVGQSVSSHAGHTMSTEEQKRPGYTAADVHFIQGMIPHHAQALDMTGLVSDRTGNESIHLLAERIEVSQQDEIAWMQRWLQDRGEAMPDSGAHQHHHSADHHALMPGMLTVEEMEQLAGATGAAFDRLFLQFMIRHHEGALVMVKELFATPGAAQASEIYRFASDVEADQRAEIQRMRTVLDALPAAETSPAQPHHH